MIEAQMIHRSWFKGVVIFIGVTLMSLGLQGCQVEEPIVNENILQTYTITKTLRTPFELPEDENTTPSDHAPTITPGDKDQPVWGSFPPPSIDPATPIPPPLKDLIIADEVLVWVLLGSDTEPPFIGRTKAIHLLFFHPRFSKASLVSIPGDLYVYIPGYTMQRLSTAYALGGIETLRQTLTYNFGVRPSRFVLAHPGDFQWLVDDINSIDVTVFYPIPHACGGIRAGLVRMDGALALCYASYRDGIDEVDRMRRQQQLLRLIFRKLTRDGNLIQLPTLYASYEGWIKTDLSLGELMGFIPLALRLADPDRINYYMIGWDQISLWEVTDYSQAQVFLPDQAGVRIVLQQAVDGIMTPEPLTNQVQTLEAQLTAANQGTISPTETPIPTFTPILTRTATPTLTTTSGATTTQGISSPTPSITTTSGATITESVSSPTPTLTPPGYP